MTATGFAPLLTEDQITADRVQLEWHTLILDTEAIKEAEAEAIDAETGRLIPSKAQTVAARRRAREVTVMHLMDAGVPISTLMSVTHAA